MKYTNVVKHSRPLFQSPIRFKLCLLIGSTVLSIKFWSQIYQCQEFLKEKLDNASTQYFNPLIIWQNMTIVCMSYSFLHRLIRKTASDVLRMQIWSRKISAVWTVNMYFTQIANPKNATQYVKWDDASKNTSAQTQMFEGLISIRTPSYSNEIQWNR